MGRTARLRTNVAHKKGAGSVRIMHVAHHKNSLVDMCMKCLRFQRWKKRSKMGKEYDITRMLAGRIRTVLEGKTME